MSDFFSAIITKEEIFYNLKHNNHTSLLQENNIDVTTLNPNFIRIELLPPNKNYFETDIEKWKLKIDQDILPKWYCFNDLEKRIKEKFKNEIFKKVIFINQKDIVIRQKNVYLKNSSAELHDNSSAELYNNSSAELYNNSSAKLYNNSSAKLYDNSSAELYNNSSAKLYGDSSAELHGNSSAELFKK